MKAGKFITAIIKETELGQILSSQVANWLAEEFSADWQTYTFGQTPDVVLHVDDNFEKIYSSHWCRDFNGCSCMVGRDHHSFYEDAVEAKAAYITDKEGYVLARAIIYTDANDQYGKKWRLLERQYSKESNEVLKRTLIDLLIKTGEIDAYKKSGQVVPKLQHSWIWKATLFHILSSQSNANLVMAQLSHIKIVSSGTTWTITLHTIIRTAVQTTILIPQTSIWMVIQMMTMIKHMMNITTTTAMKLGYVTITVSLSQWT